MGFIFEEETIVLGEIEIYPELYEVNIRGEQIDLTPKKSRYT